MLKSIKFKSIKLLEMNTPYERLSITESVRPLRKYGSTSKHVNKNQKIIKHLVSKNDTLQGVALKYEVTMEDIRRANRLYTSDSLFLREYLLIPVAEDSPYAVLGDCQSVASPSSEASSSSQVSSITSPSYVDSDVSDFLSKIDSSIASTKAEVKKSSGNSEFSNLDFEFNVERRKPPVSRMRRSVNNNSNSSMESFDLPKTIVTSGGKKLQRSLQRLENEQDEFFEL